MEKRLKITEGKAVTLDHNWSDTSVCINGKSILTLSIYDEATEDTQEALEVEMSANSELIADAFNTANETQLLPSELKEQRDELLKALQSLVLSMAVHPDCTKGSEFDDLSTIGQELINKIKDNE